MQRSGAHSSGIAEEGQKAFRQKRFGMSKDCREGRGLDPTKPVDGTTLHQDLAILFRTQH